MDDLSHFNLPANPLRHLTAALGAINIDHSGGEQVRLSAQDARLQLTEERPQVERMADDWGAICEVFKQNAYYYLSIAGVRLQAGDRVTLFYVDGRPALTLRVIEIENGRARVQDPGG